MDILDNVLCEKCHEREASCSSTSVNDGGATTTSMCEVCFASSGEPAERELFAAMKSARCRYCGGQACCGGTDSFEMSAEGQQMRFLCSRCADESYRYLEQRMEQVPHDLPQQEQIATIRALHDEVDRHMKEWASENG
jgi:protein-arginine kinase activator protein McsA